MQPRHTLAFLALFAWQVAAPAPDTVPPAKWRIGFGVGALSLDYPVRGTDCDGRIYYREDQIDYTSRAVAVEGWVAPRTRVTLAGGALTHDEGYAAALVAWETSTFGAGAGFTASGDVPLGSGPSAFLRIGDEERVHLRADLRPVTSTPGVTGRARVGVEYGQNRRRGSGGFAGLASVPTVRSRPYWDSPPQDADVVFTTAFFSELSLGIGRNAQLQLRLHLAGGASGRGLAIGWQHTFR